MTCCQSERSKIGKSGIRVLKLSKERMHGFLPRNFFACRGSLGYMEQQLFGIVWFLS